MIAIKNIKMPVNCEECFARILAWCRLDEEERMVIPALPDESFEGRPEWCPLVEVSNEGCSCSEIPNSSDSVSRRAAIDALKAIKYGLWEIDIPSPGNCPEYIEHHKQIKDMMEITDGWIKKLMELPSVQPEVDEWCTDCPAYDHEKHYCPRFRRVIRRTVQEIEERKKGMWVLTDTMYACNQCHSVFYETSPFCPNCGSYNGGKNEV